MINSKLLEVTKILTSSEMHRLGQFLRSPYFHTKEIPVDELALFDLLAKDHPDFEEEEWGKTIVFQRLYPESDWVKGKIEKKMSALLKQVERFMIEEASREEIDPFEEKLKLAKFYRKKAALRYYKLLLTNLEKGQATFAKKEKKDFYHDFLLQREISEYKSLYNNRREDLNLPATLRAFDIYYLAVKLEYSCGLLSQSNFHIPVDIRDSLTILKLIIPLISEDNFLDVPLIHIYVQVFLLLQEMDNLEAYAQLEKLLSKYHQELPWEQYTAIQSFCRSFCVRQMNRGNQMFEEKSFLLYKDHLEQGLLQPGGNLLAGTFRNIIIAGLRHREFDWVKTVLDEYKDQIVSANFPEDVYQLNLADYFFALKEYDKALDYLVDYYDDVYYHIAAKRIELKAYYELKSVLLPAKIDAFKIFIYRLSKKKLPESPREGNNNFINTLKQIIARGTQFNPKRIARVKDRLEKLEMIAEKKWLLEKLEEL